MARFIELPYGQFNPDTGEHERMTILVNLEQVSTITPLKEFMCNVQIKGWSKPLTVYRRFDTLCNQILNKSIPLDATFPDEAIAASFVEGYEKGKCEKDEVIENIKEELIALAVEWISTNALVDNWRSKFRKEMLK